MKLADNAALVAFVAEKLPPVGANVHSDQSKEGYPDLVFQAYDPEQFAKKLLETVDEGLVLVEPETEQPSSWERHGDYSG